MTALPTPWPFFTRGRIRSFQSKLRKMGVTDGLPIARRAASIDTSIRRAIGRHLGDLTAQKIGTAAAKETCASLVEREGKLLLIFDIPICEMPAITTRPPLEDLF
jgi:hypothetical protein